MKSTRVIAGLAIILLLVVAIWHFADLIFMPIRNYQIAASLAMSTVESGDTTVTASNSAFFPSIVRIRVGQSVTFINLDDSTHNIISDDNIFNPLNLPSGGSVTQTFSKPGVYQYRCSMHPSMIGKVIVK